MASADELLSSGDLPGARAALVEIVRSKPSDAPARMFLFQLLAMAGEWDKAQTQVQALAQISPEAAMLAVAYGQAIEAEKQRRAVFAGHARVALLAEADGWAARLPEAIELIAQGRNDEGIALRDEVFDQAPETPGSFNDIEFDWIGDADGRFGPTFEAVIAGRYGLVPFSAVERIKSEGPIDLRDCVWYPVQIAYKIGQSVAALLPARYPGSEHSADTAVQMARATHWEPTAWGEAGLGQHLLTLSSGEDQELLALRTLTFN